MRGLKNAGNACYLNAALQCLLYAPQLTNYFLSECPDADTQRKRVNACSLATEYAALVHALWRSATAPLDPEPVRVALAKIHKSFGNRVQQHDAHEALVALLHVLHDALAKTAPIAESVAEPCVHLDSWHAHNKGNYSYLTEVFQGQMRVDVAGPGYSSTTYEHFWDLSLAIDGGTASVAQGIARYLEPHRVDGYRHDDAYISVDVVRTFTYLPLVLVVHLKRFDNRRNKIDKFVDYAVDMDIGDARYTLFAVCLHSGDVARGHYAAMCESHRMWFYLDDESCKTVEDMNSIIQRDAYILVYRKNPDFL
jgi:ubiquitin C-terminal hydrolase